MSKKITIFFLVLSAISLQSCLFEEDLKFTQSANERITEVNEKCRQTLTSSVYGWKMAYDSNPNSCTRFFVKFKGDTVIFKSDASTATTLQGDTSLYNFKMSQGPVLSFDTYNTIFHALSNPNTSNGTKGGDSDFTIMKVTDDSIVLKGIKGQTHVTMYKASANDEANYFANNTRFKNLIKKTTSSPFFISLLFGDDTGVSMVTELNTRYLTFIYQNAEGQTIKERVSYDYNWQGFNTWKEIKTKNKTFSNFVWDATTSNFSLTNDPQAKFIFTHTTPFPYGKTVEKFKGYGYILTSYSDWFKTNVFTPLKASYDYKGFELNWDIKGESSFSFIVAPPDGQTYDPNNIFGISGHTILRDDQVSFQSSGTKTGTNAVKLSNNFYFKNLTNTLFSTTGFTVYEESGYMYLINKENSTKWLCFKLIEN